MAFDVCRFNSLTLLWETLSWKVTTCLSSWLAAIQAWEAYLHSCHQKWPFSQLNFRKAMNLCLWGGKGDKRKDREASKSAFTSTVKTGIYTYRSIRWGWSISKAAYKHNRVIKYLCYSSIIKEAISWICLVLYYSKQHTYSLPSHLMAVTC